MPEPWVKHFGLPQVPMVITNPTALVQIKEDGVRGRCRVAPAGEVDWTRVTHWRWENLSGRASEPAEMTLQECDEERRHVVADLARITADLLVAKRRQDYETIRDLGHRVQTLHLRASDVKSRRQALVRQAETVARKSNVNVYKRAAQEILPPDLLQKLYDRANAIEMEMRR